MGDNVGAEFKGTAVNGGGEGVVDYKGKAVSVGESGKTLDVKNRKRGVRQRFTENKTGFAVDEFFDFLIRALNVEIPCLDTHFFKGFGKQVDRSAVDFARGENVFSAVADVEHRNHVCRLTGRGQNCAHAALKSVYLVGDGRKGGIGYSGVKVCVKLEIKGLSHILAGVIGKGGGLINGEHAGFACAGSIVSLYAYSFLMSHFVSLFA